jgi:hypothetical protein
MIFPTGVIFEKILPILTLSQVTSLAVKGSKKRQRRQMLHHSRAESAPGKGDRLHSGPSVCLIFLGVHRQLTGDTGVPGSFDI